MHADKTLSKVWKGVRSFFAFWKDFLVGDSPVLALGVIIILCVAYLLRGSSILAPVTTIILVLILITFAVWQKTKARRRSIKGTERHNNSINSASQFYDTYLHHLKIDLLSNLIKHLP